ncbi:MAG: amidohydrolase family protein, partial [Lachnospiraceae bacterium]|nr:amidohydrolase family protein [Lachnospiraceae bacterium]
MLLIQNGRVVDPVTKTDAILDVLVDGGKIVKVEEKLSPDTVSGNVMVIDATGLVVAPGLVDTHVHFRDPGFTYKEDILTGAEAAAKGGFTTVVCMANTKPAVDNPETLSYIQEKAKQAKIRVLQTA